MKIRIGLAPDSAYEATVIERDRISGRDLEVHAVAPGEIYEFELAADSFVFAQRGRRVSDDGPGGGGGGLPVGNGRKLGLADLIGQPDDADADPETATAAASPAGAEPPPELTEASDAEIRVIMAALEHEPSVERTQAGSIQVATINKALEARGRKPINAAKRDELAAPPPAA